jgi:hypothetical protein
MPHLAPLTKPERHIASRVRIAMSTMTQQALIPLYEDQSFAARVKVSRKGPERVYSSSHSILPLEAALLSHLCNLRADDDRAF